MTKAATTRSMLLILLLLSALPLMGQASRYDQVVSTINASAPAPGGLYPALYIPNSGINICTAPANAIPCTNYATTYTSASGATACTPPAQLTRPGSNTCVQGADAEGGFGVWMNSGNYQYTITTTYGSFGPYDFSVGGSGGGAGNPAPPSFAVQLANSGATAFAADPNITINTTAHSLTVGSGAGGAISGIYANPIPNHVAPSGAYGLYGGLPTVLNVMTDCPAITGLAVVGDGSSDDYTAIQQCIWQRMFICPTFGVTCTPVDNRYPHPTNINSTGVTFLFPQRSYTAAYGVGCSFFFSQGLDIPWGVNLIGTGAGFGETATKLCWPTGSNGLWLRSNDVVEHLAIWNVAPGWVGSNLSTFVLPVGFGGASTGDGIILGGENKLHDLHIRYWGRHGIDCDSTRTDWPNNPTTNLCDTNKVDHVIIYNNHGMGVYVHGSDGGVNQFSRVSAYQNQLYGAWDDALYASQFDSYLGDANHQEELVASGTVPSISSTTCTASVCTAATSSASGLFAGDVLVQTGCSDPNLNIGGITVTSVPTGSSFTYVNPSYVGAESPTGCSVLYHPGIHIWAAVGNTTPGQLADGGCVYGAQGQWITPYCEGDQPFGTFVAQSPSVQTSVVENPQGVAKFSPVGAFIGSTGSSTTTGGVYDAPYNQVANTRLDTSDGNGGINAVFYNVGPTGGPNGNNAASIVTSLNQQFSSLYFRRTFYGPGQNASANLSNWWCFMLPVHFSGTLVPASGCSPDTTIKGLTAVGVVNGGSGYVTPAYKITSSGQTGQGATISCTNTGGVLGPCSIVTPGAGYNPNAAITVYDVGGPGTGAVLSATVGNVASTDSGRTALNGAGLWYMPNSFCFGTLSAFVPSVCWTTGTAAPTTGTWKLNDFVYNTTGSAPFGWINIAAGTPGTWTPLTFGSDSNNSSITFTTNAATSMTAGQLYYFVVGSTSMSIDAGTGSYGTPIAYAGLLKNFQVLMTSVIAAGNSVQFNVYDTGAATGLTCTMGAGTNNCNDTTHSFAASQFDPIVITATCTGTCGANSTFVVQAAVRTAMSNHMKARILFLALLCGSAAMAQVPNPSIIMVSSDPSGACPANLPWRYNYVGLTAWYCGAGSVWTKFGTSSSSGTVTSITATSPLTGGTITASGSIGIQNATTGQLGAMQVGNGLSVASGVVSSQNAVMEFSETAVLAAVSGTQYSFYLGSTAYTSGAIATTFGVPVPFTGTLQNLEVSNTVATGANAIVYTVYLNGIAQALTCTLSSRSCSDTTAGHDVSVTQGQWLTIGVVCTGTCGATSVGGSYVSMQLQ